MDYIGFLIENNSGNYKFIVESFGSSSSLVLVLINKVMRLVRLPITV